MKTIQTIRKQEVIAKALNLAVNYKTYSENLTHFFENKSTSGSNQSKDYVAFTALNFKRMKRLDKTIKVDSSFSQKLNKPTMKITWLVISETWCGDAAQVLPVLNKIAEATQNISLKLVYRDEHPELMDLFLTNGARSIPKLIALDEKNTILYTWGPRPSEATKMVTDFKQENGSLTPEFKQDLQSWYNKNKGVNTVNDQIALLNKL